MGMFDRVHFTCPRCDAALEVQSKQGDCVLADFPSGSVPPAIAEDIQGEEVYCGGCNRVWRVVAIDLPKTVAMTLAR